MAFILHDSSHNEIFRTREGNHKLANFISNIMGGVSISLWKDEHNTHHLVTNHPEHDPDIQLVPFVALSKLYFKNLTSSF